MAQVKQKSDPKSKTRWTTDVLSESERPKWEAYASDWRMFIEDTFHVEARDRAANVVPLKFRSEQTALWNTVQLIRSINIYRTALEARCLKDLLTRAKVDAEARDVPSVVIRAICDAKPEHVYRVADKMGLTEVSDGPVFLNTVKARRVGFSTLFRAFIWAYHTFRFPTNGITLSLDAPSSENILKIDKTAFEYLPEEYYWIMPPMESERDTIRVYANGSQHVARTSDGKAPRSFQIPILHATEVAHYFNGKQYAAALVGVPPDIHVFEESTGNGPGGVFHDHFTDGLTVDAFLAALDRGEDLPRKTWFRHFSPWHKDPAYAIPFREQSDRDAFRETINPLEESYLARGATLENLRWRREMINTVCKGDPDLTPEQFFMQEYPFDELEAFQKASSEIFPAEDLNRHEATAKKKILTHFLYNDIVEPMSVTNIEGVGNLHVHEKPDPKDDYLISVDSSKAVGKDQTVIDVWKRKPSGKIIQVAQFASNKVGDVLVGHLLVTLAEWYNGAFVAPEINESSAGAIISTMMNVCGYFNVLRRIPDSTIVQKNASTFNFGFYTTKQSKEQAIGELKQAVADDMIEFCIPQTIDEMRTFGRDPKDNALKGLHSKKDDRVMSAAIAVWASQPMRGAPVVRRIRERVEADIEKATSDPESPDVRAERFLAAFVAEQERKEDARSVDKARFPVTMRKVR
jgi:hypothetical protein